MIQDKVKRRFSRRLRNFIKRKLGCFYQRSYSQSGEDLVVRYIFDVMRIDTPTYLDIGAHHPRFLSNTYLLYKQGSRGVNIEPDPSLVKRFKWWRWRDITLNIGIGEEAGSVEFFVMKSRTLNTFSREEAERCEAEGQKIVDTFTMPVETINAVIEKHFETCPRFLSIDVEGLDLEIIKSLDLSKYRPDVICIEIISFSPNGGGTKNQETIDYLTANGYEFYADMYINGIFVEKEVLKRAFAALG